jgi:hypothetical protein
MLYVYTVFSNSLNQVAYDFEIQGCHAPIHCFDTERIFVFRFLSFMIISKEL